MENTISWWTFSIFGNTSFHHSFSQVLHCSLTVAKRIEMGNNLGLSTTTLYKAWCQLRKDIVFIIGVFDKLSDSIQYLNFAKNDSFNIQLDIAFPKIQFKENSADSIQKVILFNSQRIIDTGRRRKVPKKCQKSKHLKGQLDPPVVDVTFFAPMEVSWIPLSVTSRFLHQMFF